MRTLKEILKDINDWQDSVFTQATPLSAATHLQREIRELVFDLKNKNMGTAESEVADCFILVAGVAHLMGVDLEKVVAEKMVENRRRIWGEPDSDGVVEHIRDATEGLTQEQIEMLKEFISEEK